jgi:hypothetical protein
MISLRQRLKAERKATSAAKKTAEKAISSAEQNAAEVVFLKEAVKVHLTMLKELAGNLIIADAAKEEINALADATAESMGVTLGGPQRHPLTLKCSGCVTGDDPTCERCGGKLKNLLADLARSEP